jgi:YfiR/HmsC-like
MQGCQILFSRQGPRQAHSNVADLPAAPVLTVGEGDDFLTAGGMIGFLLEDNKVRFDINLVAARSAGLAIGSRLLILAQNVVGESRGK